MNSLKFNEPAKPKSAPARACSLHPPASPCPPPAAPRSLRRRGPATRCLRCAAGRAADFGSTMGNRKKKRGQERKAKAAAGGGNAASDLANQMRSLSLPGGSDTMECYHGCPGAPPLPPGHPIHEFMNTFDELIREAIVKRGNRGGMDLTKEVTRAAIIATKDKSTWESIELRQRLVTHLISVGADWRLEGNLSRSQAYAICIMHMNFMLGAQLGNVLVSDIDKCVTWPGRDITHDPERGTAMFFSKKVECQCFDRVKRMYKNEVKMGLCSLCRKKAERKKLLTCARCSNVQYCSKECQVQVRRHNWQILLSHC